MAARSRMDCKGSYFPLLVDVLDQASRFPQLPNCQQLPLRRLRQPEATKAQ
jgi:hypothetical protein